MLNSSRFIDRVKKLPLLLPLMLALIPGIAGCGGGGSSSGPPAPTTVAVYGTVQNSSGAKLQSFVVVFDHSSTLRSSSDAQGKFSIAVPTTAITASDTLTVYDPAGALIAIVKIAPSASATSFNAGPLVVGPPPPPPV